MLVLCRVVFQSPEEDDDDPIHSQFSIEEFFEFFDFSKRLRCQIEGTI